jgi:hypothetical protein
VNERKYCIIDGQHRSLVAWHLGKRVIPALLAGVADVPDSQIDVNLEQVVSPWETPHISRGDLCNCLYLTRKGHTPPRIQVFDSRDHIDPARLARELTIRGLYERLRVMIEDCNAEVEREIARESRRRRR